MKRKKRLFKKEDVRIRQIEQEGRLDRDLELGRLSNISMDIIELYTDFEIKEEVYIYKCIKSKIELEYEKTLLVGLEGTDMKVWHTSVFTCLELLRKTLESNVYEEPETVIDEFKSIWEDSYSRYLQRFSQEENIENVEIRLNSLDRSQYHEQDYVTLSPTSVREVPSNYEEKEPEDYRQIEIKGETRDKIRVGPGKKQG